MATPVGLGGHFVWLLLGIGLREEVEDSGLAVSKRQGTAQAHARGPCVWCTDAQTSSAHLGMDRIFSLDRKSFIHSMH